MYKQTYQNWEMVLNSIKRFISAESVFICHSISCIFLAKYLIKNNLKVGKVVFVSGFNQYLGLDEDFDEVNCTMYTNRLGEFKNYANTRICIYSKNDPYVKLQALQDFAKAIDAKEIVYDKAGHFNASAGYTKFEDILKLL